MHYIVDMHLFSFWLKCRFFIGLIAPRDCRPNLYVRQYGGIKIQSLKNKSVFLWLFTYMVLASPSMIEPPNI